MKRVRSVVITAGVLALVLSASPGAAIAQPQAPLLGCVKPGTGLLRIVQPGETCKHQETPLGFNDLPLLVALQQQVVSLTNAVVALQAAVQTLEQRVQELEECTALPCTPAP
jgi:hypothetical protein